MEISSLANNDASSFDEDDFERHTGRYSKAVLYLLIEFSSAEPDTKLRVALFSRINNQQSLIVASII